LGGGKPGGRKRSQRKKTLLAKNTHTPMNGRKRETPRRKGTPPKIATAGENFVPKGRGKNLNENTLSSGGKGRCVGDGETGQTLERKVLGD